MKLLTSADAKQVIDRLKRLTGQETTAPHNRPTKEQVAKIYALAAKLGWADDPKRLRAFLEKRFGRVPSHLPGRQARTQLHRSDEGHAGREDAETGKEATMEKWTDRLTIDMIPEQYRQLAEITGIQPLLTLAAQYGGSNLYIPKVDALTRTARDRLIREKFTGYNAEQLAQEFDLTVRWVQEICKDAPPAGQLSLLDFE